MDSSVKFIWGLLILSVFCVLAGCHKTEWSGPGFHLQMQSALATAVSESSGLVWTNQQLWTHNDSGNRPELFMINPEDGRVIKRILIVNSSNRDWEDISSDDQYLYIADTGNNNDNRTSTRIYAVTWEDLNGQQHEVSANLIIDISFDKQEAPNCEAILVLVPEILLFSKENDEETTIYSIKKDIPQQKARKLGTINSFGRITGASSGPTPDQIILTGYKKLSAQVYKPFVLKLDRSGDDPDDWHSELIPFEMSAQVEGIDWIEGDQYYISAEKTGIFPGKLYKLTLQ